MTSGLDASSAHGAGSVLWITGLSGTGKSTLAAALTAALRAQGHTPLLLDGDQVRHALDHGPQRHDPDARLARAWRLAQLARLAASQGLPVVVATMSLFHEVQHWNRQSPIAYAEVLLTAPLHALRARKPEVYGRDAAAQPAGIVGLDQAAQFPTRPELHWEQTYAGTNGELLGRTLSLWRRIHPNGQTA